jgi:hypothetical protein
MSDTPVYDVEAEFARIRREYGGLGDGAWAAAKWFAEALVRSRAELERQRVQDVNALMEDIRKGDEMLMAWFKAASPYATPGSLEGALKALASTLTDACVLIDGFKQGESWSECDQDVRRRLGEALKTLS